MKINQNYLNNKKDLTLKLMIQLLKEPLEKYKNKEKR